MSPWLRCCRRPASPRSAFIAARLDTDRVCMENYRGFRNPGRFRPEFRVDLVVDDETAESVFDAISFAYGAGFFSDAEAWVNPPALALSA